MVFNGCRVPDHEIQVQSPVQLPEDLVTGRDNYYATVAQGSGSSDPVGGAAYLVSKAITNARVVAFPELGMEAIREFEVNDMPVTVAVTTDGTSVHQTGPSEWKEIILKRKSA